MSNSVFPESMNSINVNDSASALGVLEEYIRYMCEKVDFALVNLSRKSGITAGELENRLVEDEMDITSLEGDVSRISGVVNNKADKTYVDEELAKKLNISDIDDELNALSENPVQNKVIVHSLEEKVRGKTFVIEHSGSCAADTDIVLGTESILFDIDEPALSLAVKSITDQTDYDSGGSVYISDNGDVIYHTGMAIVNPIIKGIVFY